MSSGNTYGLGEISHFGAFQRVGGKAGGFINKKFFHPSNLRNQEKLWLAMTESERAIKKEEELEKRRDEERQVEELRKQMYLSGQGKASDLLNATAQAAAADLAKTMSRSDKQDQKAAIDEQKRRRALLKKQQKTREALAAGIEASPDESSDEDGEGAAVSSGAAAPGERVLAVSRYDEDKHVNGHRSVWGSWYSEEDKQWGFQCCKIRDLATDCPLAPLEEEEDTQIPQESKRAKKRRRAGENAEAAAARDGEEEGDGSTIVPGGLQGGAASSSSAAAGNKSDSGSLMDERLLQASERRKAAQKVAERKKEDAKTSGYLADLLADPTAG